MKQPPLNPNPWELGTATDGSGYVQSPPSPSGEPGMAVIGFENKVSAGLWLIEFIVAMAASGQDKAAAMLADMQAKGRIA